MHKAKCHDSSHEYVVRIRRCRRPSHGKRPWICPASRQTEVRAPRRATVVFDESTHVTVDSLLHVGSNPTERFQTDVVGR